MAPISSVIASRQFRIRRQSVKYTDQRSKTFLEVLGLSIVGGRNDGKLTKILIGGMRVVKYFSYEMPFLRSK